jgi:epidermal growth factor receptor substrate 15
MTNTWTGSPNLNLSPEEQRLYTQIFSAADSEGIGVVTGDIALKFLPERTKLPSEALGEVSTVGSQAHEMDC